MKTAHDGFERTDWFDRNTDPTIPGSYECTTHTAGGFVRRRIWDGTTWISNVTNQPTTVKLPWRGVVPDSVPVTQYPTGTQVSLLATVPKIDICDSDAIAVAA